MKPKILSLSITTLIASFGLMNTIESVIYTSENEIIGTALDISHLLGGIYFS